MIHPTKTRFGAVLLFLLILAVLPAGSARGAEFEAEIIVRREATPVSGYVFVAGKKVRLDMYGPEGTVVTISRPDKGLTWIVNVPRKEYLEVRGLTVDPLGRRSPEEWDKLAEKKNLGTETVSGFLCNKVLYTFLDKNRGVVMEWTAQKLDYIIKSIFYSPQGLITTELTKIKEVEVDEVAFEIPEGYKRVAVSQGSGPAPKEKKE